MSKLKPHAILESEHQSRANAAAANAPAREVEFVLSRLGAARVFVSGDFTGWKPVGMSPAGAPAAGRWRKRLLLPPGRHEYKFVADGKWLHDPQARENVRNQFGSLNSVLHLQPQTSHTPQ